jgi:hypothetical protein
MTTRRYRTIVAGAASGILIFTAGYFVGRFSEQPSHKRVYTPPLSVPSGRPVPLPACKNLQAVVPKNLFRDGSVQTFAPTQDNGHELRVECTIDGTTVDGRDSQDFYLTIQRLYRPYDQDTFRSWVIRQVNLQRIAGDCKDTALPPTGFSYAMICKNVRTIGGAASISALTGNTLISITSSDYRKLNQEDFDRYVWHPIEATTEALRTATKSTP